MDDKLNAPQIVRLVLERRKINLEKGENVGN